MNLQLYDASAPVWSTPISFDTDTSSRKPNFNTRPVNPVAVAVSSTQNIKFGSIGAFKFDTESLLSPSVYFASLSPWERIKYKAKRRKGELATSFVAVCVATYIFLRSAIELSIPLSHFVSIAASAQAVGEEQTRYILSGRDAFDWAIGGLMAVVLIISVIASYASKSDTKIQNANDMTKYIVGFAIGFLGGGAKPNL